MRSFVVATLLCLGLFGQVLLVCGNVGTALPYGPPYTPTRCNGYSQDQFPPGGMFASVSQGLWDNGAACGRTYMLTCLSGRTTRPCKQATINVQVVDLCTENPCPANILLSRNAFSAISTNSKARINIEYIQI